MENLKELISNDDNWTVGEGEHDGSPFILRYRTNLHPFIDSGKYTKGLTIIWPYTSDNDSLIPDEELMEYMGEVEDALVEALESDIQAVLAFVFTGQNQREWHWYSSDIEETGKRINDALADFEELPIELAAEDDPEWGDYIAILEGASDAESESGSSS